MRDKKLKVSLKLRKGFFSTLLVVIGVVLVWRGIWNLLDHYFLPNNPLLSGLIGLLVGIIILYLPDNDINELA